MCTRFDSEVNSHTSTRKLVTTLIYSDQILKDFEREHSDNPNFKLWSSYMSMVEILLDFIWAEREGNWNLHL